jgi:hypothetical protein
VGLPADRERKRESEVKDIKHRDPHMRRRSMRLNALLHCTALCRDANESCCAPA